MSESTKAQLNTWRKNLKKGVKAPIGYLDSGPYSKKYGNFVNEVNSLKKIIGDKSPTDSQQGRGIHMKYINDVFITHTGKAYGGSLKKNDRLYIEQQKDGLYNKPKPKPKPKPEPEPESEPESESISETEEDFNLDIELAKILQEPEEQAKTSPKTQKMVTKLTKTQKGQRKKVRTNVQKKITALKTTNTKIDNRIKKTLDELNDVITDDDFINKKANHHDAKQEFKSVLEGIVGEVQDAEHVLSIKEGVLSPEQEVMITELNDKQTELFEREEEILEAVGLKLGFQNQLAKGVTYEQIKGELNFQVQNNAKLGNEKLVEFWKTFSDTAKDTPALKIPTDIPDLPQAEGPHPPPPSPLQLPADLRSRFEKIMKGAEGMKEEGDALERRMKEKAEKEKRRRSSIKLDAIFDQLQMTRDERDDIIDELIKEVATETLDEERANQPRADESIRQRRVTRRRSLEPDPEIVREVKRKKPDPEIHFSSPDGIRYNYIGPNTNLVNRLKGIQPVQSSFSIGKFNPDNINLPIDAMDFAGMMHDIAYSSTNEKFRRESDERFLDQLRNLRKLQTGDEGLDRRRKTNIDQASTLLRGAGFIRGAEGPEPSEDDINRVIKVQRLAINWLRAEGRVYNFNKWEPRMIQPAVPEDREESLNELADSIERLEEIEDNTAEAGELERVDGEEEEFEDYAEEILQNMRDFQDFEQFGEIPLNPIDIPVGVPVDPFEIFDRHPDDVPLGIPVDPIDIPLGDIPEGVPVGGGGGGLPPVGRGGAGLPPVGGGGAGLPPVGRGGAGLPPVNPIQAGQPTQPLKNDASGLAVEFKHHHSPDEVEKNQDMGEDDQYQVILTEFLLKGTEWDQRDQTLFNDSLRNQKMNIIGSSKTVMNSEFSNDIYNEGYTAKPPKDVKSRIKQTLDLYNVSVNESFDSLGKGIDFVLPQSNVPVKSLDHREDNNNLFNPQFEYKGFEPEQVSSNHKLFHNKHSVNSQLRMPQVRPRIKVI